MKIKLLLVHLIFLVLLYKSLHKILWVPDLADKLRRSVELPSQGQLEIVAIQRDSAAPNF